MSTALPEQSQHINIQKRRDVGIGNLPHHLLKRGGYRDVRRRRNSNHHQKLQKRRSISLD